MKIETFCRNCNESFPFKSKLHKHLCEKCVIKKLSLIVTKLFINFKKSKSHFIIIEILRIMKFIIFIFD